MVTSSRQSGPYLATAEALVVLAGSGAAITDVIRSITGTDALVGNSAMMTAALLWLNGPMRPGEIAEALGVTTGGSTKIVNRLEKSGLVRKRPEEDDRRGVVVSLTDRGAQQLEHLLSEIEPLIRALVSRLDELRVGT